MEGGLKPGLQLNDALALLEDARFIALIGAQQGLGQGTGNGPDRLAPRSLVRSFALAA